MEISYKWRIMELYMLQNLLLGLFLSAVLGGMIGIDKDIMS
jgi:uncharacterized membrane protein YhiD involved in acid resistance